MLVAGQEINPCLEKIWNPCFVNHLQGLDLDVLDECVVAQVS